MSENLPLPEVCDESREMLTTARAVLIAATSKDIPLTVAGIALACGLSEDSVIEVLNSESYRQMITENFRMKVTGVLSRGISKMDEILRDPKSRNFDKVGAFRAVIAAHDSLQGSMGKGPAGNAMEAFKMALQGLEPTMPKAKIKVT